MPKVSIGLVPKPFSEHLNDPYGQMDGLEGLRALMWKRWTNAVGMESGYIGEEDIVMFPTSHFLTHQEEWNDFKVVLSMRDPLEATLSTFYYSTMKENGCLKLRLKDTSNLTLEDISGCTPITRKNANLFGNFQCRFLSGKIYDKPDRGTLKLAKKVVEMSLIATINNLEEIERAIATSMHLSQKLFQTSKRLVRSGMHHDIDGELHCAGGLVTVGKYCLTPKLHEGLRKANWCDLELLRHAREYHGSTGGMETLATCQDHYRGKDAVLLHKQPEPNLSILTTLQLHEATMDTTKVTLAKPEYTDDHTCMARFQESLRIYVELEAFRQYVINDYEKNEDLWLENDWIFRYAHLLVNGDSTEFCDVFGVFVPIFIQWYGLQEKKGVSQCAIIQKVHELLQREFSYVTLASSSRDIVADCGFALDVPNLIVFSDKGHGQVSIPNVRKSPIFALHPSVEKTYFLSYCGFLTEDVRYAVMDGLEAGPDERALELPIRKLEMSYEGKLNSKNEPIFVGKDCYNTWHASLFALVLADEQSMSSFNPLRMSSYGLVDVLAVGTIPVSLYTEIE